MANFDKPVMFIDSCPPATKSLQLPYGGQAGRRLKAILNLTEEHFRDLFDFAYIFPEPQVRWNAEAAFVRGVSLVTGSHASLFVLTGDKVQHAMLDKVPAGRVNIVPIKGHEPRRLLAFAFPRYKDWRIVDARLFVQAMRVAQGLPLENLYCTEHGDERVRQSWMPKRRVYECGCEVLT